MDPAWCNTDMQVQQANTESNVDVVTVGKFVSASSCKDRNDGPVCLIAGSG